jgi:uncharacterized protein YsxB (DUF464 family)
MTKVFYDPARFRMEICGHAGAGRPGEDLVCAAASALTFALANAARDRDEHHAQVLIDEQQASILVQCEPEDGPLCEEMFRTVLHGFVVLKMRYPAHIKIEILEEEKGDQNG